MIIGIIERVENRSSLNIIFIKLRKHAHNIIPFSFSRKPDPALLLVTN